MIYNIKTLVVVVCPVKLLATPGNVALQAVLHGRKTLILSQKRGSSRAGARVVINPYGYSFRHS